MAVSIPDIQIFLDNYAVALSTGDFAKIACAWNIPALVASEDSSVAVQDKKEIETFFKRATEQYHTEGIATTKPSIQHLFQISSSLVAVYVDWAMFTHDGIEKYIEKTYYIFRQNKNGYFSIDFFSPVTSEQ